MATSGLCGHVTHTEEEGADHKHTDHHPDQSVLHEPQAARQQQQRHQAASMCFLVIIQPIIPRYFYTVIFSSLCHFLSILLVTVVYMYIFSVHERIASSMSTNIFEAFLQDYDHWCLRVST